MYDIFRYVVEANKKPQKAIFGNIKIDNKFNIHGHIHDAKLEAEYPDMNSKNHLCVSVEKINYKPISLSEIMERYVKEYFIEKGEF